MSAIIPSQATYVAGHSASLLLRYLDQRQLQLPELRQRLAQLEAAARIPVDAWWGLLDEIQTAHPVPALGVEIGRGANPRDVGVLGYIAMYCDTAAQALMRFSRFESLLHNLAPSTLSIEGDNLVIRWAPRRTTLLSDEVIVSGLVAVGRRLIGGDVLLPAQATFTHAAPADTSPYDRFFGLPPVFDGQVPSISLPTRFMNLSIDTRDPYIAQLLEQQAVAMLEAMPLADSFIQELQQQIVAVMQDHPPELRLVALRMGLSERSLYRQLSYRGLHYKQVLSSLRLELAKSYLRNPHLSLPEISLMLGFSDQSAFSRAFKTWTGQSPLHYRRQMLVQ